MVTCIKYDEKLPFTTNMLRYHYQISEKRLHMTKIIIAVDSFKGSGTSEEIANYIETGLQQGNSQFEIEKVAIADGGEGTVSVVTDATHREVYSKPVKNPFGEAVEAHWGLLDPQTAIIEVAQADGITLIDGRLDVMRASSYGVGQQMLQAIDQGAKTIYVGLGGSASNDAGLGMLQALGAQFLDENAYLLEGVPTNLDQINTIDTIQLERNLVGVQIIGLSDVTNPLTGKQGASYVFGPQKGANEQQVVELDEMIEKFADQVAHGNHANEAGAGAAGGIGFALLAFCHAKIESGIQTVMKLIGLPDKLLTADVVITGEGKIDGQSLGGKVPIGVAQLAKQHQLPVIAITGSAGDEYQGAYQHGIDLVIPSVSRPMTVETAIQQTQKLVTQAGRNAAQVIELIENK